MSIRYEMSLHFLRQSGIIIVQKYNRSNYKKQPKGGNTLPKGKYESGGGAPKSSAKADPYAIKDKPTQQNTRSRLWPILAAVAGVAVLAVGIMIFTQSRNRHAAPESGAESSSVVISTVELKGLPRAELEQQFRELAERFQQDLVLTLTPEPTADGQTEDPIVLTLSQADTGVGLDLDKLRTDLDAGVGREAEDSFLLDPRDYLKLDEAKLRSLLETAAGDYLTAYEPSSVEQEPAKDGDPDVEGQKADKVLLIRPGVTGRSVTLDQLVESAKSAYEMVLIAQDPAEALQPGLRYQLEIPEPLDVEAISEQYCKEPKEPTIDRKTGEVKEGKNGYGFDKEALVAALAAAKPGDELRVSMAKRKPKMDAAELRETLFKDTLAAVHTNHTNIYNRTNNLKLACKEIDGTILLPGDVFSFNKVVGERTPEKGYKEAIAYVSGGESKPEVGGGVCQVASSIYYAVLQADLKVIEREPHMFLVDYVPSGMDTTIYWGYLDFKFENSSPYPMKIEASVSGGQVHITLLGTEWKDYTVELSYEVLSTDPWKEVQREVPNDGTYYKGEVITTPYTGYKIATYKTTRDKATGKKLETTQIAISRYNRRDKVIAVPTGSKPNPTPTPTPTPTPKPTQPPTPKPTQPPTQPTQPPPSSSETEPPPPPSSSEPEPPPPPSSSETEPPPPPSSETEPPAPSEGGD